MGYVLKTAENGTNGKNVRLSNGFSSSRSSRADEEYDPHAVEMKPLSTSLGSDSEGSEEPTPYKSTEPVEPYALYSQDEETSVVRAFDRRLVLFIALLYMLSFLDRSSKLYPYRCIYC